MATLNDITMIVVDATRSLPDGIITSVKVDFDLNMDGVHTSRAVKIALPAPGQDPIPYENLTEATLLQWAVDNVDTDAADAAKANVLERWTNKATPAEAGGLPWVSEEEAA